MVCTEKTGAFSNYIGGREVQSSDGRTFAQRNPADLDEVTGLWPAATPEDATRAVEAAQQAFPAWSELTPQQRAEYLKRALHLMDQRREEIALVITRENGKTLREAHGEIEAAIREMEFQIHQGLRLIGETIPSAVEGVLAFSLRQPLGVVSVISPWNFPFNVPGRKLTPALMAGNTCVFKPASLTPQTGLKFAELLFDAGLPPGVLNFVTGGGASVGDTLTTDPRVRAISFTGSTDVGLHIQQKAATTLARTQLELGGKNPMIVLEDADLEDAAQAAATAAFACAGQWCTSTSRVIVLRSVAEAFIGHLLERVGRIVVGNGREEATTMGPVCGEAQLRSISNYIQIGQEEGARLLCGGQALSDGVLGRGCFIPPTIFSGVRPTMRIAREEIFGPVLSIIEVRDFEDALQVANDVDFGLASSIYTRDLKRALAFVRGTQAGLTHVNMTTAHKEPQLSFGGIKASGHGLPEAGATGIEFFTEHKVVYLRA